MFICLILNIKENVVLRKQELGYSKFQFQLSSILHLLEQLELLDFHHHITLNLNEFHLHIIIYDAFLLNHQFLY